MTNGSEFRTILRDKRYKKGLCIHCGKCKFAKGKKGCRKCLDNKYKIQLTYSQKNAARNRLYRQKIRVAVITKYGGICACCGEDKMPFLVIDHKNNDGNKERREKYGSQSGSSSAWYFYLNKAPRRDDLQVLCWNCNSAKHLFGECPHQTGIFSLDFSLLENDMRKVSHNNLTNKIKWPEDNVLLEMVNQSNCSLVAKKFGLHDTAVRNRLKRRGLYNKVVLRHGKIKKTNKSQL